MTAARPFKEARDLDAREAECWRMFGVQEPQWEEAIKKVPAPVVLTLQQFYAATDFPPAGPNFPCVIAKVTP